jgi:hypothetical protein
MTPPAVEAGVIFTMTCVSSSRKMGTSVPASEMVMDFLREEVAMAAGSRVGGHP